MLMKSSADILDLLNELDSHVADDLESQRLDFKEWRSGSRDDAIDQVVEMAVCMANGGGGTVVFGVKDRVIGRASAILGVPLDVDTNLLMKAVYDRTDPKITPVFDTLLVPEGTGRLIAMHVLPGMPPYTDTAGRGKIRVGKDCLPLTGTLRKRIMVETGDTDYTATEIPGPYSEHVSALSMERLREMAARERAPEDLVQLSDHDLLQALGVVHSGRMTRAGLLLVGSERSIREHLPTHQCTFLRMSSDVGYTDRMDTAESLPIALPSALDRIMAANPIHTIVNGLFHHEYRTYPEVALREALMNAFSHRDFRIPGLVLISQYESRLEITNPGMFIGGISPDNILHHPPVSRNPLIVEALTILRLANRVNLGVPRMFASMLIEGKEPPIIHEQGNSVRVTFLAGEVSVPFRTFVAGESQRGRELSVDHLLILKYLLRHAEIDMATAARICQRDDAGAREILSQLESDYRHIERGGSGKSIYWTMHPDLYRALVAGSTPEWDARIHWETAKSRTLGALRQRAERGEPGLANRDIRQVTRLSRAQVFRLMQELMREQPCVVMTGTRRYAVYEYRQ